MHDSEKRFANLLTKQNKPWVYHPRHFDLYPRYRHYEPDFYLPDEDKYIEVVGTRQAFHSNKKKYKLVSFDLKNAFPEKVLISMNKTLKELQSVRYESAVVEPKAEPEVVEKATAKKGKADGAN